MLLRPSWSHPALLVQQAMPDDIVFVIQKDTWAKPLSITQLYPNTALKQAADHYLDENPWAFEA